MSVKWNKSGGALATGGYDWQATIMDSQSFNTIQSFKHNAIVADLDWRNDNEIASLSADDHIYLWKTGQHEPLRVWKGNNT
jgi:WD40 repeat protein